MEEIVDEHFSQNFRFDEPGLKQNFKKVRNRGQEKPRWFYEDIVFPKDHEIIVRISALFII